MHALIFPQQPHQVAVVPLIFDELDQVVVVPLGGRHRLISVVEGRLAKRVIIPLNTSNFARFAADASSYVDVLADFLFAACAGSRDWPGMRRNFLNLKCAWVAHLFVRQILVCRFLSRSRLRIRHPGQSTNQSLSDITLSQSSPKSP